MRNFKLFAVALAIMVSSNIFAGSNPLPGKNSFSHEIKKYLSTWDFTIKEDHQGKVLFSLNEERKIVVHFVKFRDKEVQQYLLENLQDRELSGEQWEVGKVYALPLQLKK